MKRQVLKKTHTLAGSVKKKRETDNQALIRETFEEIGLELKKKDLIYFLSRKNTNKEKQKGYKHCFITIKPVKKIKVLELYKIKKV